MAEEKVAILNQGKGKFKLSGKRVIPPLGILEVSADEAKKLLNYKVLVDASKAVRPSKDAAKLKAENASLKAQLEQLKGAAPEAGKGSAKK